MHRLFEKELGRDWENRVAEEPALMQAIMGKLHRPASCGRPTCCSSTT